VGSASPSTVRVTSAGEKSQRAVRPCTNDETTVRAVSQVAETTPGWMPP